MLKPSLPKGTRDFGPVEMGRRNFILETIKDTFRLYGFQALETPAMENLSTLTGKYGEEGDQLLFKILNSGDFLKKTHTVDFEEGAQAMLTKIAEKGLRYDLTVPFARYVVMNRNELSFPFKRYQIQPVWRADRPQRGRYREFYQCDADVVGTDSLLCEAEIVQMIKRVFQALGISDYTIKINNRKILTGIAETIGAAGKEQELCVAIDKLDKIGWEKVGEELKQRGFTDSSIQDLSPLVKKEFKDARETFGYLEEFLRGSVAGTNGVEELRLVFDFLSALGGSYENVQLDPNLARGLTYYTGAIFEVKVNNVAIGAVSGGGRYDNLTGVFGLPDVSGVGFSFGVDRIYDVMEELGLFGQTDQPPVQVMIAHFGLEEQKFGLGVVQQLRDRGVSAEIYPESAKIKKQFNYADKKGVPYVIVVGSEEMKTGILSLKSLASGEQEKMKIEEILSILALGKK
ncbi:histidine--tRNA ligase [Pleomorphovibrio marinus]|uniref:histidine--tRNA ligase n=1 Tax=Pleomorphovibrio marinus TaxID=2164132 RepID=UPI000E0CB26A|nr:histidine--tRNA ligase [Pleomorphovibrio marinus]